MNIKDLENLKQEMVKNHEANIAFIERFLARMRQAPTSAPLLQAVPLKRSEKVAIIERIIKATKTNFMIHNIDDQFEKETGLKPTRADSKIVSQVINKLRHRKPPELHVVSPGAGSLSGTYHIPTTSDSQ